MILMRCFRFIAFDLNTLATSAKYNDGNILEQHSKHFATPFVPELAKHIAILAITIVVIKINGSCLKFITKMFATPKNTRFLETRATMDPTSWIFPSDAPSWIYICPVINFHIHTAARCSVSFGVPFCQRQKIHHPYRTALILGGCYCCWAGWCITPFSFRLTLQIRENFPVDSARAISADDSHCTQEGMNFEHSYLSSPFMEYFFSALLVVSFWRLQGFVGMGPFSILRWKYRATSGNWNSQPSL